MKKEQGHRIAQVKEGSIAEELEVEVRCAVADQ